MDQILVDKVVVRDLVASRNQHCVVIALEPLLAVICTLLVECQINRLVRLLVIVKLDRIDLAEVVLRLVASRGTKSLVVLHLPALGTLAGAPLLILVLRVEDPALLTLVRLDDRSCHIGQEPRDRN